ncbi:MAG: CehA/McbA family metallohydrolase, partial [Candidatus Poribacteria bacterium]|nr:CehA/McbA family metallohydrolase [Candidatus Poribacteria bacterium]
MADYQPLDLSSLANADDSILNGRGQIPTGQQEYHGIPFQVGSGDGAGNTVIHLGDGASMNAVTVPVGAKATHVLFAHCLLDSWIHEGDPVGRVCADYEFVYADGSKDAAPIRERFETGIIPSPWGQWALLSYPDMKDGNQPRYQGNWGAAGNRQTEVYQGGPRWFYLWAWTNPHPDRAISSIVIHPKGPKFYIGGITLSSLEEYPFNRTAKRDVKIVLMKDEDATKPFNLEVEVDRGVATYPFALPKDPVDGFLADSFIGWGEPLNPQSSPSYVEIAASPSATVTVKNHGEELGSVKWSELNDKKEVESNDRVKFVMVDEGRNWVKTTVLDDETGKPVPCRVHFRSRDGIPYQPHGHHNHVNSNNGTWHVDIGGDVRLGQITYAYIDGKCEGWLPRGDVVVDVARGYEYEPIREKIEIKPGQQELTLRLKRLRNMEAERYFSGDTHVHFLSTQGAHTEAAGEGLQVVNLLLSQWGHLFTNTEEFIGRPSVSDSGETIVYATQENRQHILGHLTLLGLKEPVNPWCSDGPGEAELGGNLETTLSRWADACHDQGGTVVIPHIPNPNCEPAALISTGRADAAEWLTHDRYSHLEYYRYLNMGYKLPICGGTDKMTSDVPVGIYRTYVHIPDDQPFTYDNWCAGLKNGNTFHSGGPLLRMTVEGKPIGSTINLPGNGGTVDVQASAVSVLPFHSLEIVKNGEVVARVEELSGTKSLSIRERVRVDKHSWIAVRCAGPNYDSVKHHDGWRRGI